jgi:LL-diaminopimelate aminotransferase
MKTRSHRLFLLKKHYFANLEERIDVLRAQGRKIYRMDIGSPDLPPAKHIIDALHQSADQPDHHSYQPLFGAVEVRQAWASHYEHHYGVSVNPQNQVLPLIGSKEGIFLITEAITDPDDIVIVPNPGYMVYSQAASFAMAKIYSLPLLPEKGWLPDFNAIPGKVLEHARLLWLNYPNNPTAVSATHEFFSSAVAFAHQYHILLCHDAAYSLVTFDGNPPLSLMQIPGAAEVAIEFNTLSKAYNMAGWRIGAAIGNPKVIQSLYTLLTSVNSGSFRPTNDAAIAALTSDQSWILNRNLIYQHRRDLVMQALRNLGWQADLPSGSLYVWFHTPPAFSSSEDFCLKLLDQTGVSLTPGSVFGSVGESYTRLSITLPDEDLHEALEHLTDFDTYSKVQIYKATTQEYQ